jgi:hypothetical protein
MDYLKEAKDDLDRGDRTEGQLSRYYVLRAIARSVIAVAEKIDSIDDALRNTIGASNPR